jgi:hypothetical protein
MINIFNANSLIYLFIVGGKVLIWFLSNVVGWFSCNLACFPALVDINTSTFLVDSRKLIVDF